MSQTNHRSLPSYILEKRRWIALYVLCSGVLMIVLDTTVVNIALPAIKVDLEFSDASLVWVVNAYTLTFGGCILLSGRLGDLYGHRRIFLAGLTLFTAASVACGIAQSCELLIVARAAQGGGGAAVGATALSLIIFLFRESVDRAKAMGVYGFVCAFGGALGMLVGGVLTDMLDWHWIFLINLPFGAVIIVLSIRLLPACDVDPNLHRVKQDCAGAITITASLMSMVYGLVSAGNGSGWTSTETLASIAIAIVLLSMFIYCETHVDHPLIPLAMIAKRNVAVANVVRALWSGAVFAWFFLTSLYMERALGYDPLEIGLAFLPVDLVMGVFALGLSARIVIRHGVREPITIGLLLIAVGFVHFSLIPVHGDYVKDVLPGMILIGAGAGVAANPILLAAMTDVDTAELGVASGVINTTFMVGGAIGLTILAGVAATRTNANSDHALLATKFNEGYHVALLGCVVVVMLAALISRLLERQVILNEAHERS
ncbi:disulfide bond formation protein DsbA [Burkholderia cepacia]|uniref:MFS transporter n=1 Tax=Burkholderia cepacia TaxID=292 RepID=UPI00075A9378|nr:MFS transporter [Burkholderia cepacia]KWB12295.1 disulfide bond formation protein DsbA [Burkholderia cepacia]